MAGFLCLPSDLARVLWEETPISLTLDVPPLVSTYPDEDEGVGVPYSVLPLRYLDHGELHWACAMAHKLLHLWTMAETQPSSLPEYPSPFTYWVKLNGVPICL